MRYTVCRREELGLGLEGETKVIWVQIAEENRNLEFWAQNSPSSVTKGPLCVSRAGDSFGVCRITGKTRETCTVAFVCPPLDCKPSDGPFCAFGLNAGCSGGQGSEHNTKGGEATERVIHACKMDTLNVCKEKEKRVVLQPQLGQLPMASTLHREGSALGKAHGGQRYIRVLHRALQIIITTSAIPEGYTLYLMFLVCASLYDFSLMGRNDVLLCFVFLIFMHLSGYYYYYFFLTKQIVWCAQGRNRAHALRFHRVTLTLVNVNVFLKYCPGAGPSNVKSWRFCLSRANGL